MTESTASARSRAIAMLVLATLYWGLSFPVIKALTTLNRIRFPDGGSWFVSAQAVAPRFVAAVILMLVFRGLPDGLPTLAEAGQGLVVGLFAAAGALLQTDGMQFTDASTSAFLTQFSAILVPAWIAVRNRRSPGLLVWACCAIVLVGVAILGHFDWRTLRFGRGGWETLLSAAAYTGQILWIGKRKYAGNRPETVTLIMFAVQAVAFSWLAVETAPNPRALIAPWFSPVWVVLTLALTIVCTIGAFSLMTRWQPLISETQAGLIYCIEPVFASMFALFLPAIISRFSAIDYPNERATVSLLIGGGLVTVANVLIQMNAPSGEPVSN
jgi:drug/metabolite transporter (DMT)-like permease